MSVVTISSASPLLSFRQLGRLCQATFSTSAPRMCASRWASACQPSSLAETGQLRPMPGPEPGYHGAGLVCRLLKEFRAAPIPPCPDARPRRHRLRRRRRQPQRPVDTSAQGPANLVIEDLTIGTGAEATGGRLLTVELQPLPLRSGWKSAGAAQLIRGPRVPVPAGDERASFRASSRAPTACSSAASAASRFPRRCLRRRRQPPAGIAGNEWIVFDVQLNAVAD